MKKILVTCFILIFTGGCYKSEQAIRSSVHAEQSILSYQKNVHRIVEAFIEDYRTAAVEKANTLYQDALASITKPDGTANVQNVNVLSQQRARHLMQIEENCIEMRKKLIAADIDAVNALEYSRALQQYFKQQTDTATLLNQSSDTVIKTLDLFVNKEKRK